MLASQTKWYWKLHYKPNFFLDFAIASNASTRLG
jgi:hypothetical protein